MGNIDLVQEIARELDALEPPGYTIENQLNSTIELLESQEEFEVAMLAGIPLKDEEYRLRVSKE